MSSSDYLETPDVVTSDPKSFEILSVWIANGNQYTSVRESAWEDPAAWGIMLHDIMRTIASSYSEKNRTTIDENLARIKLGFFAEESAANG